MKTVSAIVPAYNEAPRIGRVLEALMSFPGFAEIIVVDDGSTDGTAGAAARFDARVVRSERNLGKGAALERSVQVASGDILFFCDADIVGLTRKIIADTLAPVMRDEYDLFIAARREKERRLGPFVFSPLLDGQRALTRSLWERIPAQFKRGFAIETAMNHYAERLGYQLHDITQVKKEAKRGVLAGTCARYDMYREILLTKVRLAL